MDNHDNRKCRMKALLMFHSMTTNKSKTTQTTEKLALCNMYFEYPGGAPSGSDIDVSLSPAPQDEVLLTLPGYHKKN